MNFQVKRFQSMRTHEGGAFTYDLHIDGKRAAEVTDEGNGGCLFIRWVSPEIAKQVEDHVAALPIEPIPADAEQWERDLYPNGRKIDVELFLIDLADSYEEAKRMKRACAKKTVFRLPTDRKGDYRTLNHPFTPETKAYILQKYPQATILNEQVR